MRQLKLQKLRMSGVDVSDWQEFLAGQDVLDGNPDGIFGPQTAQATRRFQEKAGLDVDGVVGPNTLARAEVDGFAYPRPPALAGFDASVDCSLFADGLAGVGMDFAIRYYSNDPAKTLTASEAGILSGAGLQLMTVFQDVNNEIGFFSADQGTSAAEKALELAESARQPAGSAIYFAADFDPSPIQVTGPVADYFQAVHDVLAAAATQYAVGVYGSGLTCRTIRDAGFAKFTWLAGSIGYQESRIFLPQANVVQFAPERPLFALGVDDDLAQTLDFGAFRLAG